MNSKIKLLIIIGAIALFTEVFRLVNSARVTNDHQNACIQHAYNELIKNTYKTKKEARAYAYIDCSDK
tara:strand:+ start:1656 stop:1859 length:204 start_codon:yes stop_codon:yes gene_type:complete